MYPLILARKPDLILIFMKMKESKKIKQTPIVVGALGTALKHLEKSLKELEIRGRIETIQTTALLRSEVKDHQLKLV